MTIDIEKLAEECGAYISTEEYGETPFFMTRGEMIFDAESLYNFTEAYTAKVLEDKEREIAELKAKLKHETSRKHINELQAHINQLCEALEDIAKHTPETFWQNKSAQEALSKTPAQSLKSFENEVIEKCAKVAEDYMFASIEATKDVSNKIRALKGGKWQS